MAVQATPVGDSVRVALRIDPAAISLHEINGRWVGRIDVVMLFLDAADGGKGGGEESIALDLSAADREAAFASGFNYRQTLPFAAGAERLVIGVRDGSTGRVGTVRIGIGRLKVQ